MRENTSRTHDVRYVDADIISAADDAESEALAGFLHQIHRENVVHLVVLHLHENHSCSFLFSGSRPRIFQSFYTTCKSFRVAKLTDSLGRISCQNVTPRLSHIRNKHPLARCHSRAARGTHLRVVSEDEHGDGGGRLAQHLDGAVVRRLAQILPAHLQHSSVVKGTDPLLTSCEQQRAILLPHDEIHFLGCPGVEYRTK